MRSQDFDDGAIAKAGALTWCTRTRGCTGAISLSNSLVGATAADQIFDAGVTVFPDDSYVAQSSLFDNASGPVANAAAYTFGNGDEGTTGRVGVDNSGVGSVGSDLTSFDYDAPRGRYVVGRGASNRVVIVEVPEPGVAAGIAAGVVALAMARRRSREIGYGTTRSLQVASPCTRTSRSNAAHSSHRISSVLVQFPSGCFLCPTGHSGPLGHAFRVRLFGCSGSCILQSRS